MNKTFINTKWFYIILSLLFIGCNNENIESNHNLSKIDVAKWNQLTINYLIDSFRIDTTSFKQLKQPPPVSKNFAYSYPSHANVFNNDIATVWNFINKRSSVLSTIDSLSRSDSLEIIELYKFRSPAIYEIHDSNNSYKIVLHQDGNKTISKLDKFSEVISGFKDNRGVIAPIRTLTIKSKVYRHSNKDNGVKIGTLYIDSSLY